MKNISIAVLALTLILATADSYACGNNGKADLNSSGASACADKAQMSSTAGCSSQYNSGASALKKADGKVKVMTTEFRRHSGQMMNNSSIPQVAGYNASSGDHKASASLNQAKNGQTINSKQDTDFQPTILVGALDMGAFLQK